MTNDERVEELQRSNQAIMEEKRQLAAALDAARASLNSANETSAGLMELGMELAARGDRWKALAASAYDNLTKSGGHWQKAAELAEGLFEGLECCAETMFNDLGNPEVTHGPPDLLDFEDAMDYARIHEKTGDLDAKKLEFRNGFVKCLEYAAGEQMAEQVQASFSAAIEAGKRAQQWGQ